MKESQSLSRIDEIKNQLDAVQAQNEELSQKVARLETRLARPNPKPRSIKSDGVLDRRAALTALGKAALVGGAVVAGAGLPRKEAVAATGDPMVLGSANASTAGDKTTLTGSHTRASGLPGGLLDVSTGGTAAAVQAENTAGNPPLGLTPKDLFTVTALGREGDLQAVDLSPFLAGLSFLNYFHADDFAERVHTSLLDNSLDFSGFPVRAFDSRSGAKLSGEGTIDLSGFIGTDFATGVVGTLTTTGATNAGNLSVWESGSWPGTSNINFQKGESIATLAMSAVDFSTGTIKRRVSPGVSTHVIFDLIAAVIP